MAGAEEVIYSFIKMIRMGESNKRRLGVPAEMPVYSIPYPKIKKIAALKKHIHSISSKWRIDDGSSINKRKQLDMMNVQDLN